MEREANPGMREFFNATTTWADRQFGPNTTRTLAHLRKELIELENSEFKDIIEFADCFMLLIHCAHSAGFTYGQLIEAMWNKLAENKHRKWNTPMVFNSDEPVEHVREGEEGNQNETR